jgi:hypothetical protein
MQRKLLKLLAIALLISSSAYGQSLGDIARENREKKQAEDSSGAPPKVITNKDFPKEPEADQGPSDAQPGAVSPTGSKVVEPNSAAERSAERRFEQQNLAQQRAAEQWKRQILAQKNRMATLQARIDQLQASIQSAHGSVQYEGPSNRYQAQQLRRVEQIEMQLDEQKRRLELMQEAARHAGMHSAVYDP